MRSTTSQLRRVVERVLFTEPVAAEFRRAPCTRAGHHAYVGGLIEHTVAVGTLVGEVCQLHPRLDSDLLMAAALLHDVGKTREFSYGAEFGITEEGRLIGHLALGAEIVGGAAGELPPERRAALLHCVLSHHGGEGNRSGGRGLRDPRSAGALPPQCARCRRQGRARARAALTRDQSRGSEVRSALITSCAAITSASPAKVSSRARWGIVFELTTPIATPTGDSAPITSPSRTRTFP